MVESLGDQTKPRQSAVTEWRLVQGNGNFMYCIVLILISAYGIVTSSPDPLTYCIPPQKGRARTWPELTPVQYVSSLNH